MLVALVLATAAPPATAQATDEPGKVLVVSAPALRWQDLAAHDLPNIEAVASDAAVALPARGEVVMVDDNRLGVTMTEIVKAERVG